MFPNLVQLWGPFYLPACFAHNKCPTERLRHGECEHKGGERVSPRRKRGRTRGGLIQAPLASISTQNELWVLLGFGFGETGAPRGLAPLLLSFTARWEALADVNNCSCLSLMVFLLKQFY